MIVDGLPAGWRIVEQRVDGIAATGRALRRKLRVIASDHVEGDGSLWRHVSVSAPSAPLPTWDELEWVKHRFIGADRYAYQVHAPTDQHVNIHPGVLHLWARFDPQDDGRVLPDFTQGGGTI